MTGFIYAVRLASGLIKIGYTGQPRERYMQLRRAYGPDIRKLGIVAGTLRQEHELLKLLSGSAERGELFRPSALVLAFVAMLGPWPEIARQKRGPKPFYPLTDAERSA